MSIGVQDLITFRLDVMDEFCAMVKSQSEALGPITEEPFSAGMISGMEGAVPLLKIAFARAVDLKNERERDNGN